MDETVSALEIDGLQVFGANERRILAVDRLTVRPGELVAVKGPSGAGKSTFLYAIAGLTRRTRGSVRWGDEDLLARNDSSRASFRRNNIGMIFQDFLLFEELGAIANATLPASYSEARRTGGIRQRASEFLARLGLDPDDRRTVETYSGGERQRVAIARALANDPRIILADEPTASLDRTTADRLIADLCALARDSGKTLIAVSHDRTLQDAMDRVLTVSDGILLEDATNNG